MWLPKNCRVFFRCVCSVSNEFRALFKMNGRQRQCDFPGWDSIEPTQGTFDFSGVDKFGPPRPPAASRSPACWRTTPWNGNDSHGL